LKAGSGGGWITTGEGGADGAVEDSVEHEEDDAYFLCL
jgi:hypothetical protein